MKHFGISRPTALGDTLEVAGNSEAMSEINDHRP
jgi:hypothetical protein